MMNFLLMVGAVFFFTNGLLILELDHPEAGRFIFGVMTVNEAVCLVFVLWAFLLLFLIKDKRARQ
jgi:hypothetical protein